MQKREVDIFKVAEEQAALGFARYRAKTWFASRAFWLLWLLPATNAVTAVIFANLPGVNNWRFALSAMLILQLAVVGLGLVVKVMIANPPGGRRG
jgi:hypothetical protein